MTLIFTQYFSPAYKAGGPITSISNLISEVKGEFRIFARGHDLNDTNCLEVDLNKWTNSPKVWYVGLGFDALIKFCKELNKQKNYPFYVNGIFDLKMNLLPILFSKKLIISPRGMLQKGALANGTVKKSIYLAILRVLLRNKRLNWHATDEVEANDIATIFGGQDVISVIPNLSKKIEVKSYKSNKKIGHLNVVYYSLLSEKKNLLYFLQLIESISGSFKLHVYGPVKDRGYAEKCKRLVQSSPTLASCVTFHGALQLNEFEKLANRFDYFVLPTLGENYGHAIVESLALGLPVLISDKTPWHFEENSFSYSIGIHSEQKWMNTLYQLIDMDETTHLKAKLAALLFYNNQIVSKQEKHIESYKNLFFATKK